MTLVLPLFAAGLGILGLILFIILILVLLRFLL